MHSSRVKTLAFAVFLMAAQGAAVRPVGSIQAIQGNVLTLKPDSGAEVNVLVPDSASVVRVAPGQTDLKGATPLHRQDLQLGDRILVRGQTGSDGRSVTASAIIVMKQEDVKAKQEADRDDWQKRGVGGLVRSIDAEAGTITLTTSPRPSGNTIVIHTSAATLVRRYAPDSAKFDNAKPCKVADIKPGDQIRARGTRGTDGNEVSAEEVVAGAFRNIAGTIASVDAAAGTIALTDLATKKPLTVKITAESELRKLPADVAQRIAGRMKKPSAGPSPTEDFQRSLGAIAPATVSGFQKGDAVILISTEGTVSGEVTVITMVGGVEPMLTAPGGTKVITLSPWSLGMAAVAGEN
jgi:co-chaperonin GroES (HSP10)